MAVEVICVCGVRMSCRLAGAVLGTGLIPNLRSLGPCWSRRVPGYLKVALQW